MMISAPTSHVWWFYARSLLFFLRAEGKRESQRPSNFVTQCFVLALFGKLTYYATYHLPFVLYGETCDIIIGISTSILPTSLVHF